MKTQEIDLVTAIRRNWNDDAPGSYVSEAIAAIMTKTNDEWARTISQLRDAKDLANE